MAVLFDKDRTVIGRHIRNVYEEQELTREGTCANFAHMGHDGLQTYSTTFYNLDVIISVGYRVKSKRGVEFRRWANRILKDYSTKYSQLKMTVILNDHLNHVVEMVVSWLVPLPN